MTITATYDTTVLRELTFDFGNAWRWQQNPAMDFGAWLNRHSRAATVHHRRRTIGTIVALGQSWYMWQLADESDSGSSDTAEEALLILLYGSRDRGPWLYR